MTYFLDNNICFRYADMLKALLVDIVALREVFPQDIKDPDLLTALKGTDYVFISSEKRMKQKPIEARLLRETGVTALFLGPFWSRLGFWQQAIWLVRKWELIDAFARSARKGTLADIQQNGRLRPFQ